jgi:hypothetical protein
MAKMFKTLGPVLNKKYNEDVIFRQRRIRGVRKIIREGRNEISEAK